MNFKKHISVFLAFFLLVSNVGFAFNVHYCEGEVASVEAIYLNLDSKSSEKGCCEKKVSKKDNCCKDKTFHFQKKSDDSILKAFSFNANAVLSNADWKSVAVASVCNSTKSPVTSYYCEANAPPFFKLFHQYIFYE